MNNSIVRILTTRRHSGPLPQEMGDRWLILRVATVAFNSVGSGCEPPIARNRPFDFHQSNSVRWLFPIAGGEGQGGGERHN
jgi:hypothetical protein